MCDRRRFGDLHIHDWSNEKLVGGKPLIDQYSIFASLILQTIMSIVVLAFPFFKLFFKCGVPAGGFVVG